MLKHNITDQLQELRKVSLASILCENLDGVYMVQPDVFIGLDPFLNAPVTCDVFQRIDEKNIEPWKTDSPALQVNEGIGRDEEKCLLVGAGALLADYKDAASVEPNVARLQPGAAGEENLRPHSNDGSMINVKATLGACLSLTGQFQTEAQNHKNGFFGSFGWSDDW